PEPSPRPPSPSFSPSPPAPPPPGSLATTGTTRGAIGLTGGSPGRARASSPSSPDSPLSSLGSSAGSASGLYLDSSDSSKLLAEWSGLSFLTSSLIQALISSSALRPLPPSMRFGSQVSCLGGSICRSNGLPVGSLHRKSPLNGTRQALG